MALEKKSEPHIVPSYSLTGDLLSFLRCELQYRYHNGSALPPSRPVQLWYGEFIHGVMEAAYRIWSSSPTLTFPWPCNPTPYGSDPPPGRALHDIGTIGDMVEETLRSQGKISRSSVARNSAYNRANVAVNEIAPHLFPLVASAEERVIGTRDVPSPTGSAASGLRASRYELHGVIDVLTDVQLNSVMPGNVIRDAIVAACPQLPPHFEVVVDYKGARRPATDHGYWTQAEWQVQTYAWLRMRQPNALPVAAGVLLYINELAPVSDDIKDLQRESRRALTDVIPPSGSQDAYLLSLWQAGQSIPNFSLGFRLQRTIRVIPVTQLSQTNATNNFDRVVSQIEQCVATEASMGTISGHWAPGGDEDTCKACDFRHFCPNPAPRSNRPHAITAPPAP